MGGRPLLFGGGGGSAAAAAAVGGVVGVVGVVVAAAVAAFGLFFLFLLFPSVEAGDAAARVGGGNETCLRLAEGRLDPIENAGGWLDADAPDAELLVPDVVGGEAAAAARVEAPESRGGLEAKPLTRGGDASEGDKWSREAAIAGCLLVVEGSGVDMA